MATHVTTTVPATTRTTTGAGGADAPDRPLTARSVLASTLLGTRPPSLSVRRLVRAGALFGLEEGTVRTALSRMVAAGEVTRHAGGRYELAGELVARQRRQDASRSAATLEWSGAWRQAIVEQGARSATDRAALRRAMGRLRMGELRDGVWLRPDNLRVDRSEGGSEGHRPAGGRPGDHGRVDDRPTEDRERAAPSTRWFTAHPDGDADLARALWDLDGWSTTAGRLRRELHEMLERLQAGDVGALAPGFVLSASVLRHFNADPLLPRELLDRHWPGDALRSDYERYDVAYRSALRDWLVAD